MYPVLTQKELAELVKKLSLIFDVVRLLMPDCREFLAMIPRENVTVLSITVMMSGIKQNAARIVSLLWHTKIKHVLQNLNSWGMIFFMSLPSTS